LLGASSLVTMFKRNCNSVGRGIAEPERSRLGERGRLRLSLWVRLISTRRVRPTNATAAGWIAGVPAGSRKRRHSRNLASAGATIA